MADAQPMFVHFLHTVQYVRQHKGTITSGDIHKRLLLLNSKQI